MSHKTLVNGTVYEVDGGKTLIDGVAYSIDKGKTLVGGTAYDIRFCYTITYSANGGSGSVSAQTVIAGTNVTLASNAFSRYAYKFAGWNTAADGSGVSYSVGQSITPTSNITLYAQWALNGYNVYFTSATTDDNDSIVPDTEDPDRRFDETCGYVTIGGVKYTSTNTVLVEAGETISLKVSASHSDQQYKAKVYFNGTLVQDGAGTYAWQVNGPMTILFMNDLDIVDWTITYHWIAYITES